MPDTQRTTYNLGICNPMRMNGQGRPTIGWGVPHLPSYIPIKTGITIGALFVRLKRNPVRVSAS